MIEPIKLNVSYIVIDRDFAKAFVNAEYVGRVRLLENQRPNRCGTSAAIRFRCSRNPQNNTVPGIMHSMVENRHLEDLLKTDEVMQALTPIVIRNYLRNFDYRAHRRP